MRVRGTAVALGALFWLAGCGAVPAQVPKGSPSGADAAAVPAQITLAGDRPGVQVARAEQVSSGHAAAQALLGQAPAAGLSLLRLDPDASRIALTPGRSVVDVSIPAGSYVSVGVFGPADALLGFDVVAPASLGMLRAHGALDEDGILPRILSFRAPEGDLSVTLVVDASAAVDLRRIAVHAADPGSSPAPAAGPATRRSKRSFPLVGVPVPAGRDDGYLLQSPGRYQFLRLDIAGALLSALRQTRVRFRRDPIAIADITQWDGLRPATDLGRPRHISHEGGRDVDLALPAADGEPSTVRPHCAGVLVEADVQGCAPGTVHGFDALRLAYLIGLLLDGPPELKLERVFTDAVYVLEIRRAAHTLRERRWIKPEGFDSLFDDNVFRASPWHTDHIHIRWSGGPGLPSW